MFISKIKKATDEIFPSAARLSVLTDPLALRPHLTMSLPFSKILKKDHRSCSLRQPGNLLVQTQ